MNLRQSERFALPIVLLQVSDVDPANFFPLTDHLRDLIFGFRGLDSFLRFGTEFFEKIDFRGRASNEKARV